MIQTSSRHITDRAKHFGVGLLCAFIFSFIAVKSNDSSGISLFAYLACHFVAATTVLAYWVWLRNKNITISLAFVVLWAIVFRIIGVLGSPVLEDDFYRYILDGCLFVNTGSPYGIIPSSLFADNSLPEQCQEALTWMNNPDLPTIYAPALQYLFALSYIVAPASVDALQILTALFDIALICILGKLTIPRNAMLYAWCPLVLKEFALTAHPDVIGAFFVLFAFYLRRHDRMTTASIMIGIACCIKVFALLAVPFILLRKPIKNWIIVVMTIGLVYLPFMLQGATDLAVLAHFASNWNFNESAFALIQWMTDDDYITRVVCGLLFVIWFCVYYGHFRSNEIGSRIPRMDWVYGMLLLLSPVVNSWYLVWLLPFAAIRPSIWAWTAASVIALSYVTGLHLDVDELRAYQIAPPVWVAQYLLIAAAVFADWLRRPRQTKLT